MPCASRSHPLAIATSMTRPGPRPTRPPPLQFPCNRQDRNFSSSVAKERLSNSFAFDSFVRKQATVCESKKRKKTQVDFSRGVRSQPSNYAVYAPVCKLVPEPSFDFTVQLFLCFEAKHQQFVGGANSFVRGAKSPRSLCYINTDFWWANGRGIRYNRFYVIANYFISEVTCIHFKCNAMELGGTTERIM